MKTIDKYSHQVASHCETGALRNLLKWGGLEISEPMVFGVGSGPAFYYLFFAKGPSGFPLIGIRNPPGSIFKNIKKRCGVDIVIKKYRKTEEAISRLNDMLDAGVPVAASVDMFYMKYLPSFLHVHAPFHHIVLIGRQGDTYAVSDPYFEQIGELEIENLKDAWSTHAPMAKDNLMAYVNGVPREINWEKAAVKSIKKTCRNMLLPPGIKNIFSFVGVEGIRTYAKKLTQWPNRYRGSFLREGILFNAVGFEDQGTGGGAFRLMYGAFLQEISERFKSNRINELAEHMIEHGKQWREISRKIIKVGKKVPIKDEEYSDWYQKNEKVLNDGLEEISRLFLERAEFEQRFFKELIAAVSNL
ncbi:MAG: BtrH N-terminal domain-containing protein [Planctomycetes bacterium]|nr:BtrH N-terminal domain-containing protein [Planctomycetota bacterium]